MCVSVLVNSVLELSWDQEAAHSSVSLSVVLSLDQENVVEDTTQVPEPMDSAVEDAVLPPATNTSSTTRPVEDGQDTLSGPAVQTIGGYATLGSRRLSQGGCIPT